MGTFPTLVKRYWKTVEPPVSDHGSLFVKEVRTHPFFFFEENVLFYFVEEKLRCVYCSSCFHANFSVGTDRRTKRDYPMRLREVKNYQQLLDEVEQNIVICQWRAKNWSARGGRLQQVLITVLWVVLVRTRMFDFLFSSLWYQSDNSWRRNKFLGLLVYFRGF